MARENVSEQPIQRFAAFFRTYGIALGVILAAIPLATSRINLLPMYESNRDLLTFFTSLLSLLGVAFLFNIRRRIGLAVFPHGQRALSTPQMKQRFRWGVLLPALLSVLSVGALLAYLGFLNESVDRSALAFGRYSESERLIDILSSERSLIDIRQKHSVVSVHETAVKVPAQLFGRTEESAKVWGTAEDLTRDGKKQRLTSVEFRSEEAVDLVRRLTPSAEIPLRWGIEISYVLMFWGAAMAFVWLGLIEYVQAELDITDRELLENPYMQAPARQFRVDEVFDLDKNPASLFFSLEYSLEQDKAVLISGPVGPFCEPHNILLRPKAQGEREGTHVWSCQTKVDKKVVELHTVTLGFDKIEVRRHAEKAARRELASLASSLRTVPRQTQES